MIFNLSLECITERGIYIANDYGRQVAYSRKDRRHAQSSLLKRAPRQKARSCAHRQCYKDQLKRQIAQTGIKRQSWQQRSSVRKAGVTRENNSPRQINPGVNLAYADLTPSTPGLQPVPPPPHPYTRELLPLEINSRYRPQS